MALFRGLVRPRPLGLGIIKPQEPLSAPLPVGVEWEPAPLREFIAPEIPEPDYTRMFPQLMRNLDALVDQYATSATDEATMRREMESITGGFQPIIDFTREQFTQQYEREWMAQYQTLLNRPHILGPEDAQTQFGITLPAGWALQLDPVMTPEGLRFKESRITETGWRFTDLEEGDGQRRFRTWISPEGQAKPVEEWLADLQVQQAPEQVFGPGLTAEEVAEIRAGAEESPGEFYAVLSEWGRTQQTEAWLRQILPEATQVQTDFIFMDTEERELYMRRLWESGQGRGAAFVSPELEELGWAPEEVREFLHSDPWRTFGPQLTEDIGLLENLKRSLVSGSYGGIAAFWTGVRFQLNRDPTGGLGKISEAIAGDPLFRWTGPEGMAIKLADMAGRQAIIWQPQQTTGEFRFPESLYDPHWWVENVAPVVPYVVMLMGPSLAAMAVAGPAGAAAGLGFWSNLALTSIFGAAVSRSIEGTIEAGQAMDAGLDKGMSFEDSLAAADKVYRANIIGGGLIDAAQFFIPFARTTRFLPSGKFWKIVSIGGKTTVVGGFEATEEVLQKIGMQYFLDEPMTWDAETAEIATIGFVMGAGMGGGLSTLAALQENITSRLSPEIKQRFDTAFDAAKGKGSTDEHATLEALDSIGEEKEVQKITEQELERLELDAWEEQLKPTDPVDQLVVEQELERRRQELQDEIRPEAPRPGEALPVPTEEVVPAEPKAAPVRKPVSELSTNELRKRLLKATPYIQEYREELARRGATGETATEFEARIQQGEQVAAEIEAVEDFLTTSPVATYRGAPTTVTHRTGPKKGETFTRTRSLMSMLRHGEWPSTITKKEAEELLAQGRELRPNAFTKTGRVRWEYVIDDLAQSMGMSEQELINEIEKVRKQQQRLEDLKGIEADEGVDIDDERVIAMTIREEVDKMRQKLTERATDIDERKQTLYDWAKTRLPFIGKRQQATVLNAIRKVKTEKQLTKELDRIERYAEQNAQDKLIVMIDQALKKAEAKKKFGVPEGKLTVDAEKLLKTIRENLRNDRAKVMAEINTNIEQYESGEISGDEKAERNEMLALSGIEGMSSEELAHVLDEIKSVVAEGRLQKQAAREERKLLRDSQVEHWVENEVSRGKKGIAMLSTQDKTKRTNWLKQYALNQMNLGTMINELSLGAKAAPYESSFSLWAENIGAARVINDELIIKHDNEVHEGAHKVFGIPHKRGSSWKLNERLNQLDEMVDLGVFKNTEGEDLHVEYTKAELITIYVQMGNPTLNKSFIEGEKWTFAIKDAVLNATSVEEKAWGDWVVDFLQRFGLEIEPHYEAYTSTPWPALTHYLPVYRKKAGQKKDDGPAISEHLTLVEEGQRWATTANRSLKAKTENTRPMVFHSINKILVNHYTQMDHFMAWHEVIRDWRAVFNDPKMVRAIEENHGKVVLRYINDYINNLARGSLEAGKTNWFFDGLRRKFTPAILGIKPSVAIRQLGSGLAYSTQMNLRDFWKYAGQFYRNPVENTKWLKEKSPSLARRWSAGFERDVVKSMGQSVNQRLAQKGNLAGEVMLPIRLFDLGATAPGSFAVYHSEKAKLDNRRPDLTEEERERKAIVKAHVITERSQPSFNIESLSPLQNGGWFWKMLTMFMNQPNKYWQGMYVNTQAIIYGKGSRVKAGYSLFILWAVLPALFQFMADAFQYKEDNMKRAVIFGPINFLLVGGQLFKTFTGWLTGEGFDYQMTPITSTVDELKKGVIKGRQIVGDWVNEFENVDPEDMWALMEAMAKAGGQLTGIPTPWLVNAEKGIREDGDPWTLVFSQYALKPPDKDMYEQSEVEVARLGSLKDKKAGQKTAKTYTTEDYWRWATGELKNTLPTEVLRDKKASPEMKAVAEAMQTLQTSGTLPDMKLSDINTDPADKTEWTIEDYRKMYLAWKGMGNLADARDYEEIWDMENIRLGNVTPKMYDLLVEYKGAADKEAFLEKHPELLVNPQVEWLKANPVDNARLTLWGEARLYTQEAYDALQGMIDDLGIPEAALPELQVPPGPLVGSHFDYWEAVDAFGSSSSEAQLVLKKDDEYRKWRGLAEIDTRLESLQISVDYAAQDDEYNINIPKRNEHIGDIGERLEQNEKAREAFLLSDAEYAQARRRRDAYGLKVPDVEIPAYVEWYSEDRKDYEDDWFLQRNMGLYDFMVADKRWGERDFEGIPPEKKWAHLWRDWPRQDTEFDALKATATKTVEVVRAEYLETRPDYHNARYQRQAWEQGFTESYVKRYGTYMMYGEKGFRKERMLKEDDAFYAEYLRINPTMEQIEPLKIPAVQYDDLYDKWVEVYESLETLTGTSTMRDLKRAEIYRLNPLFLPDKYLRDAHGKFFTGDNVKLYAEYYGDIRPKVSDSPYEDDWFFMEHEGFLTAMMQRGVLTEDPVGKNIPTRRVWRLYVEKYRREDDYPPYLRENVRRTYPALDAWLVANKGYTSMAEKDAGKPTYPTVN